MKSKHLRCVLSILVCMTMVFTQMLPLSFADSISGAETEASAAADEDTGEAADDSEAAADTDSEAAATADADAAEAADDSAALQEEGTGEGTDEGTGEEEPTVDYNPGISWYLNDKTASTFEISTAEQLFGLAQLVNGTAVQKTSAEDAGTKVQTNFGGKTVKLTADIDLSGAAWTPAGVNGSSKSFQGTFDGQGHKISGYSLEAEITGTAAAYMGFFGYLRNATVRDFTLEGSAKVVRTVSGQTNIGGVAGYTYGKVTIDSVDVDIDWSASDVTGTVNFGGIVGIMAQTSASSHGYITDCTVDGVYDLEAETDARMGFIGGIVGETASSYVDISGCVSNLDITTYSANTMYYHGVGGIVGNIYSSYTYVYDCVNNGDIKNLGKYERSYTGGIVGYSSQSTGAVYNCVNNGDITAPPGQLEKVASYNNEVGGLIGYSSYCMTYNCVNTGNIIIPENTDNNRYHAGTLAGSGSAINCVNYGRVIYRDYDVGENDLIKVLVGDFSAIGSSEFDNLFTAYDRSSSLELCGGSGAASVNAGIFKSNGSVTPYEDSVFSYDTDDLGELLNMYAIDNSPSAYYPYRLWVEVDGVYQPVGQEIVPAATPSAEVSAEDSSAVAGTDVVLSAKISVGDYSDSRSTVTYQWYTADNVSGNDAVALTGDGASGALTSGSETVTYTLTSDKYSDMYYFIKVTNSLMYKAEDGSNLVALESAAESSKLEIMFTVEGDTSFHGESAEAFESGTGTAEDPYIIKTPQQLRLMAVMTASTAAYRSAHYRLAADIDYNNTRWSPVCQSTSAPFTGTFDGAGYTISNLMINTSNVNSGLFSNTKNATIKDLTLDGSMKSSGSTGVASGTYAGAFVGQAESSALEGLTNNMDIAAVNLGSGSGIGGIAGCVNVPNASSAKGIAFIKVANCVNNGDVTYKVDTSADTNTLNFYSSYTGGIIGKGWNIRNVDGQRTNIYNCVNYGDIRSEKTNDGGKEIVLSTAGIICTSVSGYEIKNCVNYGKQTAVGNHSAPAYTTYSVEALVASGYQQNQRGAMTNCYDLSAENADAAAAKASLNEYAALNAAALTGIRLWTSDAKAADSIYPYGVVLDPVGTPQITMSAKLGDAEYAAASAVTAENGETIALKADIALAAANAAGTDSLSYQWYKASSSVADGTAIEGQSGVLERLTGSAELKLSSAEYARNYYYVVVTDTVTYPGDAAVSADVASDRVAVTFKVNDGRFHGDASASISGAGTQEDPYLIASAADLAFVSEKINSSAAGYAEADKYYKLTADIDYENATLSPIGSSDKAPFQGHFDGNGKTVSNAVISAEGQYAGFFGYLKAAEVKNLTVKGTLNAGDNFQYAGGIAGYMAAGSVISGSTSEVTISVNKTAAGTYITYTGGIAGYITGTGAEINGCSSKGSITHTFTGAVKNSFAGGIAAYVNAGAALVNAYNSGELSFVRNSDSGTQNVYAGGIAATVSGTNTTVRNCANTGNFKGASNTDASINSGSTYNIGGIAYSVGEGAYVENCVSYGSWNDTSGGTVAFYSGIRSITNRVTLYVNYCYGYSSEGTKNTYNMSTSDSMYGRNKPVMTGNGYVDAGTGNIINIKPGYNNISSESASVYVRSDAVRNATAASGYTDVYYALNGWAGNNNTAASLKYSSWQPAESGSGIYLPTGAAEISPFTGDTALTVTLNSSAFEETFAKGATIPVITATLSGAGATDEATKVTSTWYTSLAADGSDKTAVENTGGDALKYQPAALEGRHCYMADIAVLNGAYFSAVSSDIVKVIVASDSWTGEPADIEELEGFGTADEPYIINSPYILALISVQYNADASAKPDRELDTEEGNEGKAVAYKDAYYCVTADIDMGGVYAFKPIGETEFAGHFYGKKADGTVPTIKNLYINGGNVTSGGCAALFSNVGTTGVIENLNFDNVKIMADLSKDTYAAAVAGISCGTIRNITVSGLVTTGGDLSGTAYLGGIAGRLSAKTVGASALIEGCVNNARIDAYASSLDAGGLVPVSSGIASGGITGSANAQDKNSDVQIKNCINNGRINGYDGAPSNNTYPTGATGGISGQCVGISTGITAIEGCANKGSVSGVSNAGGIAGFATNSTISYSYNTADVRVTYETLSAGKLTYAGGISGRGVTIDNCYSVGTISSGAAADGEYQSVLGLISGAAILNNCYAKAQNELALTGSSRNKITASKILTDDELKSAGTAIVLGDVYYYNTDSYPLLECELADADKCVVSIKAADETSGSAYMKYDNAKTSSINAVKGSTLTFEAAGDFGYEAAAVKKGETELTPADGVYTLNVDGSAELTATLGKASAYVVLISDYDGAAEGQVLVLYRNTALADGQAVTLDGKTMYHAAAFDTAQFDEDTSNAGYASVKSERAESPITTYAAFADAGVTAKEVLADISTAASGAAAVDYSDYDLDSNGTVDIFDAQLIWDLINGSETVSASDLQRLQADFNKDGSLTVQDVLAVHKAILAKITA